MCETKKCNKCEELKPISEFYKRIRGNKTYYHTCLSCIAQRRKEEYKNNIEREKKRGKAYRAANKEKISEKAKAYYQKNMTRIKQSDAEYYKKNKQKVIARNTARKAQRIKEEPMFALRIRLKDATYRALKYEKSKSTQQLLGCTWEYARDHIESLFTEGMSWDNRSEWHIDHIIPLSSAKSKEELEKLCHYTNLQPLWAKDNLSKGAKIV